MSNGVALYLTLHAASMAVAVGAATYTILWSVCFNLAGNKHTHTHTHTHTQASKHALTWFHHNKACGQPKFLQTAHVHTSLMKPRDNLFARVCVCVCYCRLQN